MRNVSSVRISTSPFRIPNSIIRSPFRSPESEGRLSNIIKEI